LFNNLFEVLESPQTGMLSRTIHNDDHSKIVLFSLAAGHELAAHQAPFPATMQVLRGEATVTIGTEVHDATAGFFTAMPARLVHAIAAKTPLLLLLILIKTPSSTATNG